jgi:hypothetical protein
MMKKKKRRRKLWRMSTLRVTGRKPKQILRRDL